MSVTDDPSSSEPTTQPIPMTWWEVIGWEVCPWLMRRRLRRELFRVEAASIRELAKTDLMLDLLTFNLKHGWEIVATHKAYVLIRQVEQKRKRGTHE